MSGIRDIVLYHLVELEETCPTGTFMAGYFSDMVLPLIDGCEDIYNIYYYWTPERSFYVWNEAYETYRNVRSASHKMELKNKARRFLERNKVKIYLKHIKNIDLDSKSNILTFFK
jgi:hypothetical protein